MIFLLACTTVTEPPEEEKLAEVSHQVNFESITRLGPHTLELTARHDRGGLERVEGFSMVWIGWDDFQVVRSREGRITQDHRVISGSAYTSNDGQVFHPQDDAELYRADLATTWNEWDRQLEPVLGALVLTADQETVVEGRPSQRFIISMDPEFEPAGRRAHVPTSLSGHLTVDEGTGVRLNGEVQATYNKNGDVDDPATITLDLLRGGIGQDVSVDPPTEFAGRKRKKKGKKAN